MEEEKEGPRGEKCSVRLSALSTLLELLGLGGVLVSSSGSRFLEAGGEGRDG